MDDINSLFAVEAEQYLFAGMVDDAVELLETGIRKFPDYPMAYIILAQCYAQTERETDAKKLLKKAFSKFDVNKQLVSAKNDIFGSDYNFEDIAPEKKNKDIPKETEEPVSDEPEMPIESEIPNEPEEVDIDALMAETAAAETEETVTDEPEIPIESEIPNEPEEVDIDALMAETAAAETEEPVSEIEETPADSGGIEFAYDEEDSKNKSVEELQAALKKILPGFDLSQPDILCNQTLQYHLLNRLPEPPAFRELGPISMPYTAELTNNIDLPQDEFTRLAAKLEKAKIKAEDSVTQDSVSNTAEFNSSTDKPVTETMAQIYMQQGAHSEALKAYTALKEKNPDKSDYYQQIIDSLHEKI